jgi:hypothetical protein
MQGFLFARPQPAAELEEFLRTCDRTAVHVNYPLVSPDAAPPTNANDLLQLAAALRLRAVPVTESISDLSPFATAG